MAKFTSGPWVNTGLFIEAADGTNVAAHREVVRGKRYAEDETLANGNLIASAPELYDALKAIIASLDPDNEENYRADDPEGAMDTAFEIARKALAKADGTENGE